jgi:aromatic ring-cleaving dioxygenase
MGVIMHAHIYFKSESRLTAEKIRQGVLTQKWCLFVGNLTDKAIGPHRRPQFEVHFREEDLLKAVKFFIFVRENLSILVHSLSDNDLLDHTDNCFWLGRKLKLDFSKLDAEGENKATSRFLQHEMQTV